jgi:hypothetical protein
MSLSIPLIGDVVERHRNWRNIECLSIEETRGISPSTPSNDYPVLLWKRSLNELNVRSFHDAFIEEFDRRE